jgi:SMP-30/Gluconolactonase/LRE-like region
MNDIRSRLAIVLACLTLLAVPAHAAGQHGAGAFPAWIPMPGVAAEGVAVDKAGSVFVSVREGDNGVVVRYSRHGVAERIAEMGPGMIGGLAITAEGDVYAAVAVGAGRGVYRIPRHGLPELIPGTDQIVFANALAFDKVGTLYITESYSMNPGGGYGQGGIWRVPRGGEATLWIRDALLTGVGAVLGYPVGANGIAFFHGDLYVVNTDKSLVVRVPVLRQSKPGRPEIWAQIGDVEGSPLSGNPAPPMGDGLALDMHGHVYVALVSRAAVVRLNADDRSQETVAFFQFGPPELPLNAPLDTPASLAFGTGSGEQGPLFVANLGWMSTMAPGPPWPGPGLVKIDVGVPDLPRWRPARRGAGRDR